MKKKIITTIATITILSALSLSALACNGSGAGNATANKTFKTSNDFFAMSAASGVSFFNAETPDTVYAPTLRFMSAKSAETNETDEAAPVRPAEFTDETVAEIKNSLVMFDSIVGGGVSSSVEANGDTEGDYSAYAYKMTVGFGGETAVMYYNETGVKTETEEDDDEVETETTTTLKGVLVSGANVYETDGKRKEETSEKEKEFKLELTVKKSDKDYVRFTYGTETEEGENETKYECEIYENGVKIQETEIEIEEENGKTEIKFELEKGGKKDGVEYKIVKRSENKFDIRREENKKKSYILAEKTADGYKFTYSNGFSESINL